MINENVELENEEQFFERIGHLGELIENFHNSYHAKERRKNEITVC